MTYSLNLLPVFQWIHSEFDGVDPWAEDRRVHWSVVVYRMVGESFLNAAPPVKRPASNGRDAIPGSLVIGIFARAHNRYRILPLALQDLWREGKIADQDLPWLVHLVERDLRISDYPPPRLQMVLNFSCVGLACLSYMSCRGAFHTFQLNEPLFELSIALVGLTIFCFGSTVYWRRRRSRLAKKWLQLVSLR